MGGRDGVACQTWPVFDDLLEANARYASGYRDSGLSGKAARGVALVTCIDSRIDPLAILGLAPGDAKIIRNAGARVTDDVLRSLVLAANLLGAERIMLMAHTDCGVNKLSDAEAAEIVTANTGADPGDFEFLTIADQAATLRADLARVQACPLIPAGTVAGAFVYDVHTGKVEAISA